MPTSTELANDTALTPVMRQYRAAKDAYPGTLVFFRLGDFYELFYDDAVLVARELQLTLTSRDKTRQVPMCGVPYHSAGPYLQRLLRAGYKVALCEQLDDPKTVKTIVRREVTRVLTPGTALDAALSASESRWLASVAACGTGSDTRIGVASLDLSTGDFRATEFAGPSAWADAFDELDRMRPAETLFARNATLHATAQASFDATGTKPADLRGTQTEIEEWAFQEDYAVPLLRQQLKLHSLDGLGLGGHPAAAIAAGVIVHYLRATKQGESEHLDSLRFYATRDALELDAVSVRNLELVAPQLESDGMQNTLFSAVDACQTPMGKRLLRAQLVRPLCDARRINERLDAVQIVASDIRRREHLRTALDGVLDLERLLGRIALDSAGPREVVALGATLAHLPGVLIAARQLAADAERWSTLAAALDPLADLHELITNTLVDEPPLTLSDGGAVRAGVDAELDELRGLSTNGREALARIEERERQRTGIGSLKVRFNSVFGYYIEITRANAKAIPADYERKQTLVNAERFTTPELKDLETKILTAQERSTEIERRIFSELRRQLLDNAARVRQTARIVAETDLLCGFAHTAAQRGWTRPIVNDGAALEIIAGRHPVVERRMEEQGLGRFVANSLTVTAATDEASSAPSLLLITGPNMGGKSTYLRQAALLVILAQCGCFVPAERMTLGTVDRIYTRIGASDNVARGRSTFMVEMTETAAILNTATTRSLVLLDEMGRGTATYDGLSLAWAAVEHLHDVVGARTLFATHYHELTMLAEHLSRLANLRVAVKESAHGITFLHSVEPGAASKSYGIEVARLAGLPLRVIDRAREVLKLHERAEVQQLREAAPSAAATGLQMTMFTPLSQRIVDRIAALDTDELSPRAALDLLAQLKQEIAG